MSGSLAEAQIAEYEKALSQSAAYFAGRMFASIEGGGTIRDVRVRYGMYSDPAKSDEELEAEEAWFWNNLRWKWGPNPNYEPPAA